METRVEKIEDIEADKPILDYAAKLIRAGELVVFPTETVYGIGADAYNTRAVENIFKVKRRPMDNPLIVHIASVEGIYELVRNVPKIAKDLIKAYWPGPLTLILPKSDKVPYEVTAGLDTVAIRMPDHRVALELIRKSNTPIAAPSANTSGRPSPTTAAHVIEDLYGGIPLILDGGRCSVGLESTVLDISGDCATILRPGGVTKEMIEVIIGKVHIDDRVLEPLEDNKEARSPGMKYIHYAPKAPVIVVEGELSRIPDMVDKIAKGHILSGEKVAILATRETANSYIGDGYSLFIIGSRDNPAEIAANLFATFRQCDSEGMDLIIAEAIEETHEGLAIMNRILRASAFNVIYAD
ncbi:MAG: threonylcarbamoyl-AMP synthase [Clostridiales bacterium]|nr:threonylcarbamoyl-AMP synthase [Clostridiales bacterium]